MKHLEKFSKFEGRKERQPMETQIDLSEYKKTNKCQSNCQSKVVHTDEGPKVICTYCKRLIREIKK